MLTLTPRSVRIRVRVQPRSTRDRVIGAHGGVLKLHVTAPPVGGAANQAAADLVAAWLSVPRRAVRVAQGASSRDKLLEVSSDDPADLLRQIEAAVSALR